MSDKLIPLSHCLTTQRPENSPIAYHANHYYYPDRFYAAVKYWVNRLQSQPFRRYALYTEDAYPFAVLLFALFHAGKEAWISGNNRPGTGQQLQRQGCRLIGDWETARPFDYCLESTESFDCALSPLNAAETQLVIFTSGSTGQPKPIEKRLIQFQREIATLEKLSGKQLANAAALATVSHQHIYGLLFRLLWPLSAGRCFHSEMYINPETLVNNCQNAAAYWVASPAHLKRLDQNSPWRAVAGLNAIFSSGGSLPDQASQQIFMCSGQSVIEIFGSSEAGGIGWRQQNNPWTLFEGMALNCKESFWYLHSPYLPGETALQLEDQITLQEDGRFILQGRLDRVVKIEEKRLSLNELEQRLMELPWIAEAFTFGCKHAEGKAAVAGNRDIVSAAVVLNQEGLQQLECHGRNPLIKQLRGALYQWFDAIVLPRKWLFVDRLPLSTQGKIDQPLLMQLLGSDSHKFPQVRRVKMAFDQIELLVRVPGDLVYFPDHFSSYPLLPGVVQIAWVEHFGKLFFILDKPFLQMEVIKFVKVIRPGDELTLLLDWKAASGKLHFNFSSALGIHSSGRIVYGDKR